MYQATMPTTLSAELMSTKFSQSRTVVRSQDSAHTTSRDVPSSTRLPRNPLSVRLCEPTPSTGKSRKIQSGDDGPPVSIMSGISHALATVKVTAVNESSSRFSRSRRSSRSTIPNSGKSSTARVAQGNSTSPLSRSSTV